ncbi:MAG: hypothetical protein CV087_15980 [Candidatus Brocadia sp. WS118]|nr:MAG: hypothetical protein CV087_15980 [Candidatus Brocadia sp. WS118]
MEAIFTILGLMVLFFILSPIILPILYVIAAAIGISKGVKAYRNLKVEFNKSAADMENILKQLKQRYESLTPAQKEQLQKLFLVALISGTNAFNQMSTMRQLSSLERQDHQLTMAGYINQANSMGMGIDPSKYL